MSNEAAPKYSYSNVVITRAVDGDTVIATVDLGFRVHVEMPLRIYGINTPERGQEGYHEATSKLREILGMMPATMGDDPLYSPATVSVNTIKPSDKYGRYLADIFLADGRSVTKLMIEAGVAVPYFGGKR